jgi:hypothetical protein
MTEEGTMPKAKANMVGPEIELGQAACFAECRDMEPMCPGDEKVRCDSVDVVHTGMIERVEVGR